MGLWFESLQSDSAGLTLTVWGLSAQDSLGTRTYNADSWSPGKASFIKLSVDGATGQTIEQHSPH